MNVRFVPLQTWPRKPTPMRRNAPFRAGYASTLKLLEKELDYLRARNIVIQVALQPSDIRQDGLPRANARKPSMPGVIVAFDSRHGALSFACDEFFDWQDNVRGIALTLERLRLADLYGVTRHGEQYRGWSALPAGEQAEKPQADTPEWAAHVIAAVAADADPALLKRQILAYPGTFESAWKTAVRRSHPDAGGSSEAFLSVQRAAEVLRQHHQGRAA